MSNPYDDLCDPELVPRIPNRTCRCGCGQDGEERFSIGITAGYWCDEGWDKSGYRKEGREGYDYLDAGEHYDPEDAY
jgi:hypothetical protein